MALKMSTAYLKCLSGTEFSKASKTLHLLSYLFIDTQVDKEEVSLRKHSYTGIFSTLLFVSLVFIVGEAL